MASTSTKILLTDSSGNARYLLASFTGDVLTVTDINSSKTLSLDMAASVSGANTGDTSPSTNVVTDATSDTKYPSVKAVVTYVGNMVSGLLDYRGGYDASGNAYPAAGGSGTAGAVMKADLWVVTVGGTPSAGVTLAVGDWLIAVVDTPAQTVANWSNFQGNYSFAPEDSANKVTSISGASTDVQYPSAKLLFDQLATKVTAYTSQTAKYFLAAPNAGDGVPSFRAIVASDIPALAYEAAGAAAAITLSGLGGVATGDSRLSDARNAADVSAWAKAGTKPSYTYTEVGADAAGAAAAITTITGNAGTATKLATARAINGVDFDGTGPITINAADSTGRALLAGVITQPFSASVLSAKSLNLNSRDVSSANATLVTDDYTIRMTTGASARTVNLLAAVVGQIIVVKKVDSGAGAVSFVSTTTCTIDGSTTRTLTAQWESVILQCVTAGANAVFDRLVGTWTWGT